MGRDCVICVHPIKINKDNFFEHHWKCCSGESDVCTCTIKSLEHSLNHLNASLICRVTHQDVILDAFNKIVPNVFDNGEFIDSKIAKTLLFEILSNLKLTIIKQSQISNLEEFLCDLLDGSKFDPIEFSNEFDSSEILCAHEILDALQDCIRCDSIIWIFSD